MSPAESLDVGPVSGEAMMSEEDMATHSETVAREDAKKANLGQMRLNTGPWRPYYHHLGRSDVADNVIGKRPGQAQSF